MLALVSVVLCGAVGWLRQDRADLTLGVDNLFYECGV
jgi:hypothetical protein